jgi:hypothetical protein
VVAPQDGGFEIHAASIAVSLIPCALELARASAPSHPWALTAAAAASINLHCVDYKKDLSSLEKYKNAELDTLGKTVAYAMRKAIEINIRMREQKKSVRSQPWGPPTGPMATLCAALTQPVRRIRFVVKGIRATVSIPPSVEVSFRPLKDDETW